MKNFVLNKESRFLFYSQVPGHTGWVEDSEHVYPKGYKITGTHKDDLVVFRLPDTSIRAVKFSNVSEVMASAVEKSGSSSHSAEGEGDAQPMRIFNVKASTVLMGTGLTWGLGFSLMAYHKFSTMDWENVAPKDQGKSIGRTVGNFIGSIVIIGIGFALSIYENKEAQDEKTNFSGRKKLSKTKNIPHESDPVGTEYLVAVPFYMSNRNIPNYIGGLRAGVRVPHVYHVVGTRMKKLGMEKVFSKGTWWIVTDKGWGALHNLEKA